MPTASISSGPAASGGLWSQIQQQQAQRNAEQAEQKARALQGQARNAQSEADRAQENARTLKVESNQAQGEASAARRGVLALASLDKSQAGLNELRGQIAGALESLAEPVANEATLAPVVNAYGQQTGTMVNITA